MSECVCGSHRGLALGDILYREGPEGTEELYPILSGGRGSTVGG